jgi:hypothetical protein
MCAAPSNPTQSELISEALAMSGEYDPSSSLITRANLWFEEIKNDIWRKEKKLKSLQKTCYAVFQSGQSRYSYPSSFSSDLSLTILDGQNRGTAQGGTVSSITLSSSDPNTDGDLIGREILITSGLGVGSFSQITGYNSTTKLADVTPDFDTAPDGTSTYMIKDVEYDLEQRPISDFKMFQQVGNGRPGYFFPLGDEDYGEFILNQPPDKVYGARIRYYANIMTLDTSDTLFSNLLLQWRNIWLQGIVYRRLRDANDDRSNDEFVKYRGELQSLINREKYGTDMSFLRDMVSDFR